MLSTYIPCTLIGLTFSTFNGSLSKQYVFDELHGFAGTLPVCSRGYLQLGQIVIIITTLWLILCVHLCLQYNNILVYMIVCVCTLEPFPPPDDFRLSHINFLQRLQFTWTMNDTYRNCPSLFRIYLYNCSSTCKFSRGIVCSDISTVAQICLFQLQYSICDDIRGNASNLVNVTLKGETYII